jgi:hypothetical protein
LPDLDALHRRFTPDDAAVPDVRVELADIAAYDALLSGASESASALVHEGGRL